MALTTVRPQGMGFNTGRRNMVINGAMQVAQRGTSHTDFQNNGAYTLDRFAYRRSGTISSTTFDVTQENTSGLPEFPKCIQIQVKDAAMSDPNTPASARNEIKYTFEGQDLQHLQYGTATAQAVTVSFYVKSSVAGTYSWYWEAEDSQDTYIAEYTINSADTWEYKTITVPAPTTSQVDTVIANDNTTGLKMGWTGYGNVTGTSDHRTSTTGWQAAPSGTQPLYTDNQANAFSTLDNTFSLTGIQVEVGENASDFEHRSYGEELTLCQRYYYRIGEAVVSSNAQFTLQGRSLSSNRTDGTLMLPSPMRAVPSVSVYESSSTTLYPSNESAITLSGETYSIVGNDSAFTNLNHVNVRTTGGGTITNGHAVNQRYSGAISLDAEL